MILDYILERVTEKTTWLGVLNFVSATYFHIPNTAVEWLATGLMSLASGALILVKEKKSVK